MEKQLKLSTRKADRKLCALAEGVVAKELAVKYKIEPDRILSMYRSQFKFLAHKIGDQKHDNIRIHHIGLFFTHSNHIAWCIKQDHENLERLNAGEFDHMIKIKHAKT